MKLTKRQRIALAAVLGGTNTGLAPPQLREVADLMIKDIDLVTAVYRLWSKYAETEEMAQMFIDECDHWYHVTLKNMSAENVQKTWSKYHPELAPIFVDHN